MAIPADTVWEVNTTGSDTAAGGGFSIAQKGATGTDLTYPTPTITTFTSNLSAVGTTTLTCSAALFLNTMLGNVIQISGQGFYCIQGFTSTTVVTVDRNLGTFATTSGWVGGALASPGQAGALLTVSGQKAYVKTGTYTLGSASANVAGGTVLISTAIFVSMIGYSATRDDNVNPPTFINASFTSLSMASQTGGRFCLINFIVDGNSQTGVTAVNLNTGSGLAYLVTARNSPAGGFTNGGALGRTLCVRCVATGCAANPFNACICFICEAYSNTTSGFINCLCSYCLSYGNTGASSTGFSTTLSGSATSNCTAYGNGSHGFSCGSVNSPVVSCYAEGNTGSGFAVSGTAGTITALIGCGAYNNTGGAITNTLYFASPAVVTPAATAFVNAASSNFALNNNATGGALLRAAGIPGLFPRGLTQGYLDIGAAQHADPVKLLTLAGMTGGME